MKVTAKLNYLRTSPRKIRLVANLIKGMDVEGAQVQLHFLEKRAARPILKLLNSAIANAENNFNLSKSNLFVLSILVNQGPTLKRFRPRARGVASDIAKRTSHIELILEERKAGIKKLKKKVVQKPSKADKKKEITKKEKAPIKEVAGKEGKFVKGRPRAPKKEKRFTKLPSFAKRVFRRKSI